MSGFDNEVLYADGIDLTNDYPNISNQLDLDGKIYIGSSSGRPKANIPTSSDSSVTISTGDGTLDLVVDTSGTPTIPTTFQSDSGNATPAANILIMAGGTGIDTTGAGNTITVTFDVTEVPTIPTSISTDSGTATPSGNALTIAGGPGVTVTASGATITVNSVVYTDQTATTLTSDSGTFATAAGAFVLPASPAQGERVEIVALASGVVVTGNTGQEISIGSSVSSTAGTATSTAVGDGLCLVYRSSDTRWYSVGVVGIWTLA